MKFKFPSLFLPLLSTTLPLITIVSCASKNQDLAWPFATNLSKVNFNWNWQPYLETIQTNETNFNKAISIPLGWFASLVAKAANLVPEAINYQWLSTWFQVDQGVIINTDYLNRVFNQSREFKQQFFQFCFGKQGWFNPLVRLDDGLPYQSLVNNQLITTDRFDWIEFVQFNNQLKMYCYIIDQTGQQALVPFWAYPSNQDAIINNYDHFQFDLKIPISFSAIDQNAIPNQQVIINQPLNYQVNPDLNAKIINAFDNANPHFNNLKNYLLKQNIQVVNQPNQRVVLAYLSGTSDEQLLPVAILERWLEQRVFNFLQQPIQYLIKTHQQISLEILNSDLFVTINGWSTLNQSN